MLLGYEGRVTPGDGHRARLVDRGDHEHDLRMALRKRPTGRDPTHARHPLVHDHKLGREFVHGFERRLARSGLSDKLESVGPIDDFAYDGAKVILVIDGEDPDRTGLQRPVPNMVVKQRDCSSYRSGNDCERR
jgi:hypothetical protein